MPHDILQVWGGFFFLLNKIFFSRAERNEGVRKRVWRIRSWTVYIIGLPAWVIIFVSERNWIAASVETGGATAMILGLIIAMRGLGREPRWLNYIALFSVVIGIGYSVYDFSGITTINQVLELCLVAGFLIGTYLLARERPIGYLWFMLMNVSNALLMYIEHFPWLALQQVVSLAFVADAYVMQKRKTQ